MTNKEKAILAMIRDWSDNRLLSEIDQAAAYATDNSKSEEQAFSALAAAVVMLREKDRRGLSSNSETTPTDQ